MSSDNPLVADLRAEVDDVLWYAKSDGHLPSPALERIATEADDATVAGLLDWLTEPSANPAVRQCVLVALGQRGTPVAVEAIASYEAWAAERGVHLRPAWPSEERNQPHGVCRDRDGRDWALFQWSGWDDEGWWLTWSDDGSLWEPASRLPSLRSPTTLLDELAHSGRARLDDLGLIADDTALLDRLLVCVDQGRDLDSVLMGDPEQRPWDWRQVDPVEAAIAQAVWLVAEATSNSRQPLLLNERTQLAGMPLRGAMGPLLPTRRSVLGWRNLSLRRLGQDRDELARRAYSVFWGPLSARGYEATVELKHDRWVTTEYRHTWIS